jgi:hypothetical protein
VSSDISLPLSPALDLRPDRSGSPRSARAAGIQCRNVLALIPRSAAIPRGRRARPWTHTAIDSVSVRVVNGGN